MIVKAISDWLIRQKIIEEGEKELYEYAIQSFWYSVAPIILSLIIGGSIKQVQNAIAISISLCLIRRYSGGYHAPCGGLCIFMSVILLVFSIHIQRYMHCNKWLFLFIVFAIVSLSIFSPIDSSNRPLGQIEKKQYKKCTVAMGLYCAGAYLGAWLAGREQIACCIATGIGLAAFLQFPCIPKLLKDHLESK